MAATTQAVDASEIYEMWNFGNDSGAMPLEDSSGKSASPQKSMEPQKLSSNLAHQIREKSCIP